MGNDLYISPTAIAAKANSDMVVSVHIITRITLSLNTLLFNNDNRTTSMLVIYFLFQFGQLIIQLLLRQTNVARFIGKLLPISQGIL